jgi:hypothetical protein
MERFGNYEYEKAKFAGLNFGSSEVLLKDAQKKVNGGTGYCYDY